MWQYQLLIYYNTYDMENWKYVGNTNKNLNTIVPKIYEKHFTDSLHNHSLIAKNVSNLDIVMTVKTTDIFVINLNLF